MFGPYNCKRFDATVRVLRFESTHRKIIGRFTGLYVRCKQSATGQLADIAVVDKVLCVRNGRGHFKRYFAVAACVRDLFLGIRTAREGNRCIYVYVCRYIYVVV